MNIYKRISFKDIPYNGVCCMKKLTRDANACFDLPGSTLFTIVPLSGLGPDVLLAQTMQTSNGNSLRHLTTS